LTASQPGTDGNEPVSDSWIVFTLSWLVCYSVCKGDCARSWKFSCHPLGCMELTWTAL